MSVKSVQIETVNVETGEIINVETNVYSVADEKFFMLMLTKDNGKWIGGFSKELYVLVLILDRQVKGSNYCSLTSEDKKEISSISELTISQVNKIIRSLEKKNMIKKVSKNRVSVNPNFLHYGKTKEIKSKKREYERDY